MRSSSIRFALFVLFLTTANVHGQVLIDSIPYPGTSQGFWGIHVTPDTIFLGADGPGHIFFSTHGGTLLGNQPTGYTYNHGLIKRPTSYLIAKDYTGNGALLHEVGLTGGLLNTWTFPPVIGGNSSGIGDLCADGNAVWYTMYFPDFDDFPFAYAYKWVPGAATPIDTVPLHGEQPYGVALKGDTLFYVTDNLNGDQERIYAYDLTNEVDLGWVELPDTPTDNDMSPRGMFYDGTRLYLIANRQGGNAFAYQTVYIYDFDLNTALREQQDRNTISFRPNPMRDEAVTELPFSTAGSKWMIEAIDALGRRIHAEQSTGGRLRFDTSEWKVGAYVITARSGDRVLSGTVMKE